MLFIKFPSAMLSLHTLSFTKFTGVVLGFHALYQVCTRIIFSVHSIYKVCMCSVKFARVLLSLHVLYKGWSCSAKFPCS